MPPFGLAYGYNNRDVRPCVCTKLRSSPTSEVLQLLPAPQSAVRIYKQLCKTCQLMLPLRLHQACQIVYTLGQDLEQCFPGTNVTNNLVEGCMPYVVPDQQASAGIVAHVRASKTKPTVTRCTTAEQRRDYMTSMIVDTAGQELYSMAAQP